MMEMVKNYMSYAKNEKGQGIVEYALILAFVVAIAAFLGSSGTLTSSISSVFSSVQAAF